MNASVTQPLCSGLEAAVPWVGSIQPEGPAGRHVEIDGPDLDILDAQITTEVHVALTGLLAATNKLYKAKTKITA